MTDVLPPPVQDALDLQTATTQVHDQPDAHTQRYDRQLRLWANSGQTALENARILVVGANPTATQLLKNLVLPGIGHFTLTSPVTSLTPSDLGTNFFLSPSDLSQPLASSAVAHLLELNPSVSGAALALAPKEITDEVVKEHSLVVAVDVEGEGEYKRLADLAWENKVPFVGVRSVGFFGLVRTQVEELTIVETHPASLVDLRITSPFPSLLSYASTFDYPTLDSAAHGHVPAVIILVKALSLWRSTHGGEAPKTFAERKEFVKLVLEEKRQGDEENFDEAVALWRSSGGGTRETVPKEIEALFEDEACQKVNKESSSFWLLLASLRRFVTLHSSLPLSGALPDMKASSSSYVALQNLYKQKAGEDVAEVTRILSEVCEEAGAEVGGVGSEEVETFVKHAAWVRVVRGRRVSEELEDGGSRFKGKTASLLSASLSSSPPDITLLIYAALRASDAFHTLHSRYPGLLPPSSSPDADEHDPVLLEKDAEELEGLARKIVGGWKGEEGWEGLPTDEVTGESGEERVRKKLGEVCREIVRTPPTTTLPQTSALLGGLVAQEVIKLVTKQYIPLGTSLSAGGVGRIGGETCVWDGVRSGTGVLDA